MKKCTKCKKFKLLSEFSIEKRNKDGLKYQCRSCRKNYNKNYRRTKKGLIKKIYSGQIGSSKKRGHKLPNYTEKKLIKWVLSQSNFELLYNNWVESGYKRLLVPSCDRLEDNKPYTLNNLRLVAWCENNNKGNRDRKNGINNVLNKAIIGINIKTGEVVKFYSISEASRQTGIYSSNISKCCSWQRKSAGGYKWKHNN